MELSIQERLKDLRVERGLTLEQLAEQTHLSKSALGSYEAEDFKDISHYAIIKLAKFYGVTAEFLQLRHMEAVGRHAEVGGTPENREESGGNMSKRYDNLWKKMVDFALKKDGCYGTL